MGAVEIGKSVFSIFIAQGEKEKEKCHQIFFFLSLSLLILGEKRALSVGWKSEKGRERTRPPDAHKLKVVLYL